MTSLDEISIKFTEQTLDEIVRKCGGQKHIVWKFGSGFKKGDSYLSDVYRMIVDGVKENGEPITVNLVIKSLPKNIGRRKTFRSADFFRNECNFYNVVLEKFIKFQQVRNVKNPFVEVPRCLANWVDGENDFVALEDVSVRGYRAPTRQDGLDFNHCSMIMKALGRFHAVSLAIKDQEPDEFVKLINSLEETYYAEKYRSWYALFLRSQIIAATDAITKEYGDTKYEKIMKNFTDSKFYDRMIDLTHRNGKYSVLGHGDCWVPNFLVRYSNDQPIESIIIDFQLARYGSPALDISFFIYSGTTKELREKHYDELLKIYHKAASELITELGSNVDQVYPFTALLNEMNESARFGVGMAMESLPLSIMDDSETADLDSIVGDEAIPLTDIWIIKPIENQKGRLRLADVYKHAIDNGYLSNL